VRRDVDPAQAAIVRRVCEVAAAGKGLIRTPKMLNAEGLPGPGGGSWTPSSVREMLRHDVYRGVIVWNKTKWLDKGGTQVKVKRPRGEWLTAEASAQRTVDDALWAAVQARLAQRKQAYLRTTDGKPWGRPRDGARVPLPPLRVFAVRRVRRVVLRAQPGVARLPVHLARDQRSSRVRERSRAPDPGCARGDRRAAPPERIERAIHAGPRCLGGRGGGGAGERERSAPGDRAARQGVRPADGVARHRGLR
jgi:hypothetical protein